MGKAARRKRERPTPPPALDRPHWAGADGFDYAWKLDELYLRAAAEMQDALGEHDKATATMAVLNLKKDVLGRRSATLGALVRELTRMIGDEPADRPSDKDPGPVFPGLLNVTEDHEKRLPYALGCAALAASHHDALRESTPLLFDPLAQPELDDDAIERVRLPFSTVTCDFLNAQQMSMPVQPFEDMKGNWVGLVAATLREVADGVIDVWPVVTTLTPDLGDLGQRPHTMLYGYARFGGELPDPPEGLYRAQVKNASVWTTYLTGSDDELEEDREARWTYLWTVAPAWAAASALRLLEAVNVDLAPVALSRPARRRAEREGARPALEVVVRTSRSQPVPGPATGKVDWQHRWAVRGHWKHFTKGPIFNANPRKRVVEDGSECVKVWCPPFVKGPEDKPLVFKSRRVLSDTGLDSNVQQEATSA